MVESEDLSLKQQKKLSPEDIFFRGGAFKPLTFPYRSSKYNEMKGIRYRMAFQSKIICGNSCNYGNNGN